MKSKMLFMVLLICSSTLFILPITDVSAADEECIFKFGTNGIIEELDPQLAYDSFSMTFIEQICETLFKYNLSSPQLEIIPCLAEDFGTWNANATIYTVKLQKDIVFHDGNIFDAYDVKWTFDRLEYLIRIGQSQLGYLYAPLENLYPENSYIINSTNVIDDYTIEFVLNYPYIPFISLLCFTGSSILSLESTSEKYPLNLKTSKLIGTGAYRFKDITTYEMSVVINENWWGRFPEHRIEEINWVSFENTTSKIDSFLSGEVHMIDGFTYDSYEEFDLNPNIVLGNPIKSSIIYYIGMNNNIINQTMRQALSWAFNYSSIIEDVTTFNSARLISPVPENFLYHNPNLDVTTTNLTKARTILIEAGLAPTDAISHLTDDNWWINLTSSNPIQSFNYTWNTGNEFRAMAGEIAQVSFEKIGIRLILDNISWSEYLSRLLVNHNKLDLFIIGWGADVNDPSNFINPLFSNDSASNMAEVNDPYLQLLMDNALIETNETLRKEMYYEMQRYLVEELMPWIFLIVPLIRNAWSSQIGGIQINSMSKIAFSHYYWTENSLCYGESTFWQKIPGIVYFIAVGCAGITCFILVKRTRKVV